MDDILVRKKAIFDAQNTQAKSKPNEFLDWMTAQTGHGKGSAASQHYLERSDTVFDMTWAVKPENASVEALNQIAGAQAAQQSSHIKTFQERLQTLLAEHRHDTISVENSLSFLRAPEVVK